jgi:restriction system protein
LAIAPNSGVNQDRSLIATNAEMTTLTPRDARSRLETALEFLRREWRDGCRAGMPYQAALGSVRRLPAAAASEQIAADLSRVIDDLAAYTALPPERRPSALTEIAAAIKRLIPEVARLEATARPMNVMGTAQTQGTVQENSPNPNVFSESSLSPATMIAALHRLSPTDFEMVVASLLQAEGFNNVQPIGGANDRGVDILCNDAQGSLVAVQCKRYGPAQKIGAFAIQHLATMSNVRNASRRIFVTTSSYTDSAVQQALDFEIELVDGYRLAAWLAQYQQIVDWVNTYHQSLTGEIISDYSIIVDPVKIPDAFYDLYRADHPARTRIQSLLNRHHPSTPATIRNPNPPEDITVAPLPTVTPDQFRQALALREYFHFLAQGYQCASDAKADKKRSRSREQRTFRVYLLDSRRDSIRDYAVQYDPNPDQTYEPSALRRFHYLTPGHVVTPQDLWNFWTQLGELGATARGYYYTNSYFSCGTYLYLLDQPPLYILSRARYMVDGLNLPHWFAGKEDEFMSLATQPSLPECFIVGDIPKCA